MNAAESLTFQPGDVRGYDAIAAVVTSNLSLLLKSFDELRNPETFRPTVASERFAKKICKSVGRILLAMQFPSGETDKGMHRFTRNPSHVDY